MLLHYLCACWCLKLTLKYVILIFSLKINTFLYVQFIKATHLQILTTQK